MDSNPQLKRIDQLADCAVATERPLVVLTRTGKTTSAIISARMSEETDDACIRLEDCHHFRFTDDHARCDFHPLVEVMEGSESGYWLASPDDFESVFGNPSRDPYAVIELGDRTARAVYNALEQRDFKMVFTMIRVRFAELPRFLQTDARKLKAASYYATGRGICEDRFTLID
ncbi:MAG: hypothetical protein AAGB14_00220 [Verrucomicrobiota bacterium]